MPKTVIYLSLVTPVPYKGLLLKESRDKVPQVHKVQQHLLKRLLHRLLKRLLRRLLKRLLKQFQRQKLVGDYWQKPRSGREDLLPEFAFQHLVPPQKLKLTLMGSILKKTTVHLQTQLV